LSPVAATPVAPEEALAFWLAGTADRRAQARGRIVELAGRIDFDQLSAYLQRQRLLALLGFRLIQICDTVPASFVEAVERQTVHGQRHQLLFAHQARSFARLLEDRGIEAVPLKGPLLAERIYANPGHRGVSSDLDYLVRADRLDEAVETIRTLGYELRDDDIWADGLPHYHYGLVPADPAMPKIELHWRVHWYERRFASDLVGRSELDRQRVRLPVPDDEFAALLLIYARDGFVGLRFAADIAAWWDAHSAVDQLPALGRVIDTYPELRGAIASGAAAAHRVAGLPPVERGLAADEARLRPRLAAQMVNWRGIGTQRQVARDITLIDLLLTPPGAYRIFWRHYYLQPLNKYVRDYEWDPTHTVRNRLRRIGHALGRLGRHTLEYAARLWELRRAGESPGSTDPLAS
jgi:hypothetical protein